MKLLKFILLIFFFYQSPISFSQKDDTLGLNRFFWGVIPSALIASNGKREVEELGDGVKMISGGSEFVAVGVQFEVGNYWAFNKKKHTTGFFRFTWIRIGVHNYGLLLAPAQVGLGFHIDYNKSNSLEAVLNGGLIIYTDDALDPDFEFNYAIYPQIRFNINRFSIGLEYTYHRYEGEQLNLLYGYHYFGIVLGGRFGKKIN